MTSSGKVRIYELSRDMGLDNKDVLDAAIQLGVAAKSHSSSISDDEAAKIRSLISKGGSAQPNAGAPAGAAPSKAILSVKKAEATPAAAQAPRGRGEACSPSQAPCNRWPARGSSAGKADHPLTQTSSSCRQASGSPGQTRCYRSQAPGDRWQAADAEAGGDRIETASPTCLSGSRSKP